jgi:hypothetical protein
LGAASTITFAYDVEVDTTNGHVYLGFGAGLWGRKYYIARVSQETAKVDDSWAPFSITRPSLSTQAATTGPVFALTVRENDVLIGMHFDSAILSDTSLVRLKNDGSYVEPFAMTNNTATDKNVMFRYGRYLYVSADETFNTAGVIKNLARVDVETGALTQVGSMTAGAAMRAWAQRTNGKFVIVGNATTGPFTHPVYGHGGTQAAATHRVLYVNQPATPQPEDYAVEGRYLNERTTITWAGPDIAMASGTCTITNVSNPTNGKQFFESNLTFEGAHEVVLSSELFANVGTYELFEVTGTITGLNLVTCTSEAGFTCSAPFIDGNIVKVTLA